MPFSMLPSVHLFLGLDIGRKEHPSIIDVGEKIGETVWDRLRLEMRGTTFAALKHELYRLLRLPQLKRACIDATGLGMQLAEEAQADFGWKVEPVTFTPSEKASLALELRRDFEDGKLRIARDEKLRADLRALQEEARENGPPRFEGHTATSHCDRFWALALRQRAARYRVEVGAMVG